MQIQEPTAQPTAPLWRLAFRAGFLFAAIFAALAMGRWGLWMLAPGEWRGAIPPHWWHGHEMTFGFAMPVVAGFILTAVANWTGMRGTTGFRLQLLFGLWLIARIALWWLPQWPLLAWLGDTLFLALLTYELISRVWAQRQWRNMLFLPLLLTLMAVNTISFLSLDDALRSTALHYGAVWLVTVFVTIIGGRVIPLFTGNRLGFKVNPLPPWFEYLAIGSIALLAIWMITLPVAQNSQTLRAVCLLTGALHTYRLFSWRGWKTLRHPLLWSMHLAYACIPLSLFLIAIIGTDPVALKNIVHLLAIGTIGGMILSMMSRVSQGHTGRAVDVPAYIGGVFGLLMLAALLRALLPLLDPALTQWAWRISAVLWIVVFTVFTLRYWPMLTTPRPDGKPG